MQEKKSYFTYLMLLAMLFWGGGWPALKILTPSVPLEVVTFWRFAIMLIALIPLLIYFKIPMVISKKSIRFIVSSAILNILFMVFAFLGVKYGHAGSGGVIITTLSPLFTFVLVTLLFKHRLNTMQIMGLFIGIIGGMIMLEIITGKWDLFVAAGNLYYIFAALIWAVVTIISQKSQIHIHPLLYSFCIACVATTLLFFTTLESDLGLVFQQDIYFWGALLYLGILGQTIATTIYFIASGKLGSAKASSFMFIVPLSALLFSYYLIGEPLKLPILVGGTLSMIAVYFINTKRHKTAQTIKPI